MATILNASPAASAPNPSGNRGDETRGRENAGNESGPAATVTFAAVLKSRSNQAASADGGRPATAKDGSSAVAAGTDGAATTQGIGDIPPFPILLSLAVTDQPVTSDPALPAATSPDSLIVSDAVNPATPALAGLTPAGQTAEQTRASAVAAHSAFALESSEGTLPGTVSPKAADAVAPAPTLGNTEARGGKREDTAQRSAQSPDVPFDRKAPAEKLAVEPAISAETVRPGSRANSQVEGGADFRSMLDRFTGTPANATPQASGNTPATAPPPSVRIETGFGQAGWNHEMGEKLTWMVGNGRQQADLVLNPPQLGRIEVTMVVEGDNVSASFASPNAVVREALENSMSRLREVLAEAGVALGNTYVGAESRQDAGTMWQKDDRNAPGNRFGESNAASVEALASGSIWRSGIGRGMVDVFA
jgi:flagellar hook-length control protein FliK